MEERVYDPNDYNTLEDVSEQFFCGKISLPSVHILLTIVNIIFLWFEGIGLG